MIQAIYENLCPVCGRDLTPDEILKNVCFRKNAKLSSFSWMREYEEFVEYFRKFLNSEPKAIQKTWMKRLVSGESFSIVAPTGLGKTSFGVIAASFLAQKRKKCYIVLPTTVLVREVSERLKKSEPEVVSYHANLSKNEKEEALQRIKNGEFSILVTTSQFLAKNFDVLKDKFFDFIFVDDVDSIFKTSRNVDRILHLLGFRYSRGRWFRGSKRGILVVSTATVKKGRKANLLRELLGIDVGSSRILVRNVEDIYCKEKNLKRLCEIINKMGDGGLIFVSTEKELDELLEELEGKYRIGKVTAKSKKDFDRFKNGELDYLIGTSHYYGTLVRGLDLPEKIRYAVFWGAPVFRIPIGEIENLSDGMLKFLVSLFRDDPRLRDVVYTKRNREEVIEKLKEILEDPQVEIEDLIIKRSEIIIPDLRTYLQASGRTSRLTVYGLTKGASFLLENNIEILKAFVKRATYYDITFKPLEEVNFDKLLEEIAETRSRIAKGMEAEIKPVLFVVESPTKAKQIARFFGQPAARIFKEGDEVELISYEVSTENFILTVTASLGHITDLTTGRGVYGVEKVNSDFVPVYASIKRCEKCGYQYTRDGKCPICGGNPKDSKNRIRILQRLAEEAEHVIIGTDPDTEGEKIAWDIKMLLAPFAKSIKRAEFHEVTKRAVISALKNLREIDENTVKAQIVRRVEDRWLGFRLSEILQKRFRDRNLSAGRAQTPVLGWIIQRCDEHRRKKRIGIIKELGLVIENPKGRFVRLKIEKIGEREEDRIPPPPYTTDTMLEDANRILRLSVTETMKLAQELFENGFITYHRTDSTRVSERGMQVAREFLKENFVGREWKKEGAHECIRPTRPLSKRDLRRLLSEGVFATSQEITVKHLALYDLIFRRFMASQAPRVRLKKAIYRIKTHDSEFTEERVIHAEGKAFELYRFIDIQKELPETERTFRLDIKWVPQVPLFTQSDVIALMKQRGIGRPSTYSQILNKLFLRKYIFEKNQKLIATRRGRIIFWFLYSNYAKFVSEQTTRELEKTMDMVERGEADYMEVLRGLYTELTSI